MNITMNIHNDAYALVCTETKALLKSAVVVTASDLKNLEAIMAAKVEAEAEQQIAYWKQIKRSKRAIAHEGIRDAIKTLE